MNEQAYQSLPNIVTEQIVIETKTSARMIPVTAEKKGIDEINRALERAKKEHDLLGLYRSKDMHMEDYYTYGSLRGSQKALDNLRSVREEIEVLEKELEEMK